MDTGQVGVNPDVAANPQALLEEAKQLVEAISAPSGIDPLELRTLELRLQSLQKSHQGWQIADGLLAADSANLKFFGALTFTVKIAQDWSELSEENVQQLRSRLVSRFVFFANNAEKNFVIKKLASTLIALYWKPNISWRHILWNLGVCLLQQTWVSETDSLGLPFETEVLPSLNASQINALLTFSDIFAEEAIRVRTESRDGDDKSLNANFAEAFSLCNFVLNRVLQQNVLQSSDGNSEIGTLAIESYGTWVSARAKLRPKEPSDSSQLASATENVVKALYSEDIFVPAATALHYMISEGDKVLSDTHMQAIGDYLIGPGSSIMEHLLTELDSDRIVYADLLLSFTGMRRMEVLTSVNEPSELRLLWLLEKCFEVQGFAGAEDKVASKALEWWTDTAEEIQDWELEDLDESEIRNVHERLAKAVLAIFAKAKWPPTEHLSSWDSDDRSEFLSFRRDVGDFLLASFPILGAELVSLFQQQARSALNQENWLEFEATIFCLSKLSEAIENNEEALEALRPLFGAEKFAAICNGQVNLPSKVRLSMVDMLGRYEELLKRTPSSLISVLTFLFASLHVPHCENAASKSILSLCESCRLTLNPHLSDFVNSYQAFSEHASPSALRVLQGIASLIQSLSSDGQKVDVLHPFLSKLFSQATLAQQQVNQFPTSPEHVERAIQLGQGVVRCLASIGRGLRAEPDSIIDIESDSDSDGDARASYWQRGPGAECQSLILRTLEVVTFHLPEDMTIVEGSCDIFKAGYTESSGLFVFPPDATVKFVKTFPLGHPGSSLVINTAAAFLASYRQTPAKVRDEARSLIIHIYELFLYMRNNPQSNDPDVINSCIDFLTRVTSKYVDILISQKQPRSEDLSRFTLQNSPTPLPEVFPTIVDFTLEALQSAEPLPLRSAAQFWVALLSNPNEDPYWETSAIPALCFVVIRQIGGRCARSDLDHLSEVMKKLAFKHQRVARPKIEQALEMLVSEDAGGHGNAISGPPAKSQLRREDARRFLSMWATYRGSRETTTLVKDLWVKCRGAGFGYYGTKILTVSEQS